MTGGSMKPRTPLREVARYLSLGGGVLLFISLFLTWGQDFDGDASLFELARRFDIALLIVALAVVGLVVADILVRWEGLLVFAGGLGAFAAGAPFWINIEHVDDLPAGWWVAGFAALAIVAGGILALLDVARDRGGSLSG
jgi:hypothetical protein